MNAQLEEDLASGALPDVLVPGDLAGFGLAADTLRAHARVLEGAGDSLSRVDVTNWRGQASVGFLQVIQVEPGRWRTAADAFSAAAVALDGYTASLAPARELARQAREAYQRYEATLAAAALLTDVPSSVPGSDPTNGVLGVQDRIRIGARYEQMNAIAAGGALRGPAGSIPAAAAIATAGVYSADALRRQAIALLDQARRAVEQAGNHAADALGRAMEQAPAARRFNEATIRPAGVTDSGHTTLDTIGMIPVLGEVADGVNGLWYLNDGDTLNAGLSAAGMLPLVGDAVIGGRLLYKGTKLGKRAAKAYKGIRGPETGSGWLKTHEINGSHTLQKHVAKSIKFLRDRLGAPGSLASGASSFFSAEEAELYIGRAIELKGDKVSKFLANPAKQTTHFEVDLGVTVGYGIRSGARAAEVQTAIRVVLVKDPRFPDGYRIWTAHPIF